MTLMLLKKTDKNLTRITRIYAKLLVLISIIRVSFSYFLSVFNLSNLCHPCSIHNS